MLNTQLPHTGMIYYSALVQDAPADLRRKVGVHSLSNVKVIFPTGNLKGLSQSKS